MKTFKRFFKEMEQTPQQTPQQAQSAGYRDLYKGPTQFGIEDNVLYLYAGGNRVAIQLNPQQAQELIAQFPAKKPDPYMNTARG